MAEFQETMKQWERLCQSRDNIIDKCKECLLRDVICMYKPNEHCTKIREAEILINMWAARNPEHRYPTWYEWLSSIGVAEISQGMYTIDVCVAQSSIPADIAQKLGLEPKEGK